MHSRLLLVTILVSLLCIAPAVAEGGDRANEQGTIEGHVVDAIEDEPLPGANVRLRKTDGRDGGRQRQRMRARGDGGQATDADGRFRFEDLTPGTYTLRVSFIGYAGEQETVRVEPSETTTVEVALTPSALDLPDVVVTGGVRDRAAADVYRPTSVLTGDALQEQLDNSVPATLSRVPGFSMESFGPGAARPNIRGMGGDRVLMLEDGQRTGDLYATASDHGVMVEPLTAERMEVIRGPASLLHGPNALGGVANVIRNDIPRERPNRVTGMIGGQGQSVNNGVAGGGSAEVPIGPFVVRGEVTGRTSGDMETPLGPMERTDLNVVNASLGGSWITDWGLVGGSYRFYDNTYGIPGEFNGELIEGGHPGGVDIEAERHVGRFRALYDAGLGFFDSVELDANLTRYIHDEIEVRRAEEDFFGARFDQTVGEVRLMTHHEHEPGDIRAEGAFGASVRGVDIEAFGSSPGMRSGQDLELALFGYEELGLGPFRIQLGVRYDHRRAFVDDKSDLRRRTREGELIQRSMGDRTFNGLSGSLAALYEISSDWTLGASLSRAFRSPHLQELYSDGPHLADFSYDIGEPNLDPEFGHGAEVFVRASQPRLDLEVATYYNRIQNYIFHRNTGQTVLVDRRGELGRVTPVFLADGADAEFLGAEGRVQWEALPNLVVDATATYTRATRLEDSDPLPFIPPLNGELDLRYQMDSFFVSVGTEAAASQTRVPNPVDVPGTDEDARPQQPTDGYGLLNAGLGYTLEMQNMRHHITLHGNNLTNEEYRNHLSRTKEVAPEPGRNLRLTYRVNF